MTAQRRPLRQPAEAAEPAGQTVSQRLQAILDGPTDEGNAVSLPPGEHLLEEPLVVRRWRTRVRRQDKWGGSRATFVGPHAAAPFRG